MTFSVRIIPERSSDAEDWMADLKLSALPDEGDVIVMDDPDGGDVQEYTVLARQFRISLKNGQAVNSAKYVLQVRKKSDNKMTSTSLPF
jgi:hypothetical protein